MKRHSGSKKLNISASALWTAAAILLISILLTASALVESLEQFSDKTEPNTVISLLAAENEKAAPSSLQSALPPAQSTERLSPASTALTPTPAPTAAPTPVPSPHFYAGDDSRVWGINTQVDIFRSAYENASAFVTAVGANGDKIVAPGTHNTYCYRLTNDGDVPIYYIMNITTTVSDTLRDYGVPVRVRLCDENGEWLCGSADEWESFTDIDGTEKKAVLGAGRYSEFTLDWDWPYESGEDELDTLLGSIAEEEKLILAVNIDITAEYDPDAPIISGHPQTGDDARLGLWLGLMLLSVMGGAAVTALWLRRRGSREV